MTEVFGTVSEAGAFRVSGYITRIRVSRDANRPCLYYFHAAEILDPLQFDENSSPSFGIDRTVRPGVGYLSVAIGVGWLRTE